ncbi:MAG: phosphomannomutase/phosphoglucomutase [Nitrospinota bacterium]|jgi:phosphomannomutase/phosphoglucomutase|nr:phosphomannomutase/phosphoglucomutase [Nitrospinota bacterium]MDP6617922.1 phosphomannomutase/phosphoglucomutase [Nitrospinota bacterium]
MPTVNREIFREYDIRGVVEDDLDVPAVRAIGRAIGTALRVQDGAAFVVGRDVRPSSPAIRVSLIDGLRATGAQVSDAGVVPTPVLYFAAIHLESDGAVMVTASHNPPEFNGFKICRGVESLAGEEIRALADIIERRDFSRGNGRAVRVEVLDDYRAVLGSKFSFDQPLKVVVDGGNGVMGELAVRVIESFGHEVIPLYCEPDGDFPNHHPDPSVAENLEDLIETVRTEGADLGVAFDGDGDRLGAVDEKGAILWPDYLMILFARDVLSRRPGAPIVFEVKCSMNLIRAIEKAGGRPVMWKAGHSLIKKKLKEENAPLAGEFSGHMFFADDYYGYDDALYAALRLLDLRARAGAPLSSLLADVPPLFASPEIKLPCPDAEKFHVVEGLRDRLEGRLPLITLDGVRADFGDGWGLVRASNTTGALTARFEAASPERLEEIRSEILGHLKAFSQVEGVNG